MKTNIAALDSPARQPRPTIAPTPDGQIRIDQDLPFLHVVLRDGTFHPVHQLRRVLDAIGEPPDAIDGPHDDNPPADSRRERERLALTTATNATGTHRTKRYLQPPTAARRTRPLRRPSTPTREDARSPSYAAWSKTEPPTTTPFQPLRQRARRRRGNSPLRRRRGPEATTHGRPAPTARPGSASPSPRSSTGAGEAQLPPTRADVDAPSSSAPNHWPS